MSEILNMLGINCDNSFYTKSEQCSKHFSVNENNRLLWSGAEKCGFQPEKIPRNTKNCVNCGHCCFGCSHGSKQSTVHTFLEPTILAQAKGTGPAGKLYIIPDCKVDNITYTKSGSGRLVATGVKATATIFSDTELGPGLDRKALKTW